MGSKRTRFWMQKQNVLIYSILALAVLAYGIYFSLYQIQAHRALWTGVDLTNMEQTIWNTFQGDFMRSTVYPPTGQVVRDFSNRETESRLGTHVQPILLLLALPYALVPCSETLLVLMSVAVGLGAIPVFRLARRRLHSSGWALAFAVGYLLLPAVETNSAWDVHGLSFLPPLLLAALDAAESGKRGWWWFWALLAMGCREDIPFLTGWAMLWLVPCERRREALAMFGVGLGLSLLNFLVIIPHFGKEGTPFLAFFFPPGTEMSAAGMLAVLARSSYWQAQAMHFLEYNLRLGLPLLFLYWLHLPSLLAMAPLLILNGCSWFQAARLPFYSHYSSPIVPWALVGAAEGLLVVERLLAKRRPAVRWRGLLMEALGVSVLAAAFLEGYLPLSRAFVWPRPIRPPAVTEAVLREIPENAALSASLHLAPRLAQRETLRLFPDTRDVDWIVLDLWFWGDPYGNADSVFQDIVDAPNWEVVTARDGILTLRCGSGPPTEVGRALQPSNDMSLPALDVQFGDQSPGVCLTGVEIFPLPLEHFILCTDWVCQGDCTTFVPQIGIQTNVSDDAAMRYLNDYSRIPELFSAPHKVRDCTQLFAPSGDPEMVFRLLVADDVGKMLPVSIMDIGAWEDRVMVEDDALVLRVHARE